MTASPRRYKVWEPLWLSMAVLVGMIAGSKMMPHHPDARQTEPKISNTHYSGRQVEEIIRFLETRYVGHVDADTLVEKAIAAIMEGLDPHTHYFAPDQMEEIEEKTMGHYVGIGVEIVFIQDSLVVLYPKKGGPALKAGIEPGDYIIAINGKPIPVDSLDKHATINQIKGTKGTKVKLTIKPMYDDSTYTLDIMRDEIKVPSVPTAYMVDSSVAYIRIDRFIQSTYREFMDHWEKLSTEHNAKHLILDLRNNPGGYLKEAVNILSQIFADEGELLVYTQGVNQDRIEYRSTGKVFFPIENVVLLINEGSASASEIMAGCLQDHDRGVIIGTRSYGKGLVQEQFDLSNGGTLRMTVSKYYTPSGRSIQKSYDAGSVIDTSAIYMTTSGREVHAGGGIVPDIEMRDPIDWNSTTTDQWMTIISEYAIRYNIVQHDGRLADIHEIPAIQATLPSREVILKDITELAKKRVSAEKMKTLAEMMKTQSDHLYRIATSTLIAYRTGEEGWYRAYNQGDPVIRKAKEVIRMDVLLALQQN